MKQTFYILLILFLNSTSKAQTYEGKGNQGYDSYDDDMQVPIPKYDSYDDDMRIPRPKDDFNVIQIFKENDKYGLRKSDSVILNAIYDEITHLGTGFLLKQNNLYGVAIKVSKLIIPVKFDKITFSYLSGKAFIVSKKDRYGSYDIYGNVILPVKYAKIIYSGSNSGASVVEDYKGKTQLVFKNLEICKMQLENIEIFSNGVIGSIDGKFGILKDGKVLLPFEYESITDQNKHNIRKMKNESGTFEYSVNSNTENNFMISKNQKLGLLNSLGEFVLEVEYDKIKWDNLRYIYLLTQNKLSGIYFVRSKKLLKCEYQSVYTDGASFVTIKKNNKYGIVDYSANFILPIEFDEIRIKGWNNFFGVKKDGKKGYYGTKGEVIIPIMYDDLEGFYESKFSHLLKATLRDSVGVINLKNEVVIPIRYKFVYVINDFIKVGFDGKRGLFNSEGKEICKPIYDRIYESITSSSPILFTEKDELKGIIGRSGDIIFDPQFKEINYIHNEDLLLNLFSRNDMVFQMLKHKNGKFGVFEEYSSKLLIPLEYDSVCQRFELGQETYFIMKKGKKYGVLNNKNEIVIGFHYEHLSFDKLCEYYSETDYLEPVLVQDILIVAKKNSKYGLIDLKEKIWIPFQYSAMERLANQPLFKAAKGKNYALIDQNNKILNAGPFDDISYYENHRALTFYEGQMRVIDAKGKFIASAVKMNPHQGYKSFEELKQALIKALNDPKDESLQIFAQKISPSNHLLYFLKNNVFTDEELIYTNPEEIKEIYYNRLLNFKRECWNSDYYDKRSLTEVQDFTLYSKNIVTNRRTEDHAFGDTRFMEKVLRNSIKINGYWISTYFMNRKFYND